MSEKDKASGPPYCPTIDWESCRVSELAGLVGIAILKGDSVRWKAGAKEVVLAKRGVASPPSREGLGGRLKEPVPVRDGRWD